MKIIFDYNRTVFNPDTGNLYPGVLELASDLSKIHELFIVGKNEPGRTEVLQKLGIHDFFKKIIFVNEKSTEIFKEIAGTDSKVIVVGDRIYGEITLGNKLNYITVWLRQGKFVNEIPKSIEQEPKHTIGDIVDLREIIKIYE